MHLSYKDKRIMRYFVRDNKRKSIQHRVLKHPEIYPNFVLEEKHGHVFVHRFSRKSKMDKELKRMANKKVRRSNFITPKNCSYKKEFDSRWIRG